MKSHLRGFLSQFLEFLGNFLEFPQFFWNYIWNFPNFFWNFLEFLQFFCDFWIYKRFINLHDWSLPLESAKSNFDDLIVLDRCPPHENSHQNISHQKKKQTKMDSEEEEKAVLMTTKTLLKEMQDLRDASAMNDPFERIGPQKDSFELSDAQRTIHDKILSCDKTSTPTKKEEDVSQESAKDENFYHSFGNYETLDEFKEEEKDLLPQQNELFIKKMKVADSIFGFLSSKKNQNKEEEKVVLPIRREKTQILDAIKKNQIVVLCADTGLGKTTQVPQIVFEQAIAKKAALETVFLFSFFFFCG